MRGIGWSGYVRSSNLELLASLIAGQSEAGVYAGFSRPSYTAPVSADCIAMETEDCEVMSHRDSWL